MTIESLRSEVTPNLGSTTAIKAADQLFSKDKRVYTDVKPVYGTSSEVGSTSSAPCGKKGVEKSAACSKLNQTIEAAKKTVNEALSAGGHHASGSDAQVIVSLQKDVAFLKSENQDLRKEISHINQLLQKLTAGGATSTPSAQPTPPQAAAPAAADDDFDLFGSDEEEESAEQAKIRQDRLDAYAAKKAKKPGPIAKSSVLLDVKVWDDTTDLKELEAKVRSLTFDGLVWGAAKFVAIGYGIQKLQILCTIEDEKVSVDSDLVESIQDQFEELVQSVDIVAFNKI